MELVLNFLLYQLFRTNSFSKSTCIWKEMLFYCLINWTLSGTFPVCENKLQITFSCFVLCSLWLSRVSFSLVLLSMKWSNWLVLAWSNANCNQNVLKQKMCVQLRYRFSKDTWDRNRVKEWKEKKEAQEKFKALVLHIACGNKFFLFALIYPKMFISRFILHLLSHCMCSLVQVWFSSFTKLWLVAAPAKFSLFHTECWSICALQILSCKWKYT